MNKLQPRRPRKGLTKVEIDFGSGSRARTMWEQLHAILYTARNQLRARGNNSDARLLYDWQQTYQYKVVEAPHWIMELSGEEWQALSRGLRLAGTSGRSMYAWIMRHKVDTYG